MNEQIVEFVRENAFIIVVLLGIAGAFIFLRTRGTELESVDALDHLLAGGQPVVVEFYSNT
jgi:hypothetical protein